MRESENNEPLNQPSFNGQTKSNRGTSGSLNLSQDIPLRLLLVIPFIVQIVGAVGLTGWLSLRNGQQAVREVTLQLRDEASARIKQNLDDYLEAPRIIAEVNTNSLELGQLDTQDYSRLTRTFWRQRDLFSPIEVSAIYFGTVEGEFTGLGFQNDQTWQVGRAGEETQFHFYSYATDRQGNPTQLLEKGNPYDPRVRPWYKKAVDAQEATWSDVYTDFKEPRLKITLAEPVFQESGELWGVLGVDFVLSHIRTFLQAIKIGESGKTFIMDRSGFFVATSGSELPFVIKPETVERLPAVESENTVIQKTALYLYDRFTDLEKIETAENLQLKIDGERYFLQVVPFSQGQNLDWLIVVIVPESDFMGQIHKNTQRTIALCFVALFVATGFGWVTAKWITDPIMQLSNGSRRLASAALTRWTHESLAENVEVTGVAELKILAQSFNQMANQLQESFTALEKSNEELELRVEERTADLRREQEKSETLLLNILPEAIAKQLKQETQAIAEHFESVTILFSDIVGFTSLSSRMAPIHLVTWLNELFSSFDYLAEKHGLEKIKTIGDAYMVVGGLPVPQSNHQVAMAAMALEMQESMQQFCLDNGECLQIRIGIHTGPVVAGVIGVRKFSYDLWGDTVNVASRMESSGMPGKIQVSEQFYERLQDQFEFEERGIISVKGKGKMKTYWLQGTKGYSALH
ncbi:adenylate/guanylate cyclase domain-containing protein [Roseofilum capinflatum]|uniref:Adenylate/guanylate cyclase domain-containing protein n=1 Tax=Roseofilum capinflatum BLCC-M114 TaxID=3022440 RepID=A0ABT7BDG8_9CYAN|nr:adenylate/guanylate cyclase domain-containing protein [Roseofilum capinflatum]MDJ1176318.1 adenylate/guanylate cyclase domain-containing protein [Roseofilum capinflatum BLCC-M114]